MKHCNCAVPKAKPPHCSCWTGVNSGATEGFNEREPLADMKRAARKYFYSCVTDPDGSFWQLEHYVWMSVELIIFFIAEISFPAAALLSGCSTTFWKWETMSAPYETSFFRTMSLVGFRGRWRQTVDDSPQFPRSRINVFDPSCFRNTLTKKCAFVSRLIWMKGT